MNRDVIVIGASAGGVEALQRVAEGLDSDFCGAAFIVLHMWANSRSRMPEILARNGHVRAQHASDGEAIVPGRIYVAPPGLHMLLERDKIRLVRGPRHNRHRPAIDVLFHSAARAFGPRVIGVLLTGADDDGAAGLAAIKAAGGLAIVQDPDEAAYPTMPESAMRRINVDYAMKIDDIGRLLREKSKEEVPGGKAEPPEEEHTAPGGPEPGTAFSCPECGGVLAEKVRSDGNGFRCQVGHFYTFEGLLQAESESVERALWAALRALEESASVSRKVAAMPGNTPDMQALYEDRARAKQAHAKVIRDLIGAPEVSGDAAAD